MYEIIGISSFMLASKSSKVIGDFKQTFDFDNPQGIKSGEVKKVLPF